VYVANAGAGGTNVTGFILSDGSLDAIPNSTVALPEGSGPGDVLFNTDGRKLVVTLAASSEIASYDVRSQHLFAAPGSPYSGQGLGQIGAEFRPPTRNSCLSPTPTTALVSGRSLHLRTTTSAN